MSFCLFFFYLSSRCSILCSTQFFVPKLSLKTCLTRNFVSFEILNLFQKKFKIENPILQKSAKKKKKKKKKRKKNVIFLNFFEKSIFLGMTKKHVFWGLDIILGEKKKSQIFAKFFFSDHQLWPMKFFWIFGIFFKATTSHTVFDFDCLLKSAENRRNHDFSCFYMFLAKYLAKKME